MKPINYSLDSFYNYKILNSNSDKFCVMCGRKAVVIAIETNEPLCDRCRLINNEARMTK